MFFERLGLDFRQVPSRYEEDMTLDLSPSELVMELSRRKAFEVASREDGVVVACDTMVFFDDKRLGKPKDKEDCINMLKILSGRDHQVISGLTVMAGDKVVTDHETTEVHFRVLSDEEIERYAKTDEPYDKAGSYAIQGSASVFIDHVNGSYTNIVGLPVPLLLDMLKRFH